MKVRFLLAAALCVAAPSAFGTLTFTPIFDATLTALPGAVTTIDNTLALYSGLFSTNINVTIYFANTTSGLGESTTSFYSATYGGVGGVCSKLAATSSGDATDTSSIAATGSCGTAATNNPVNSTTTMFFSSADGRAMGFNTPGAVSADGHSGLDAEIQLNSSSMNVTRPDSNSGFYDMQSVVEHEVDEVLGTISGLNGSLAPAVADLFRYSAPGTRSFTTSGTAYLSVNGGTTNLATYNNVAGCNVSAGDCGDFDSASVRVQNAFGTPGAAGAVDISQTSPEGKLLDAVGYTFATVPEPGTFVLMAGGLLALGFARRRFATR
jgi:hypothetical protein